MSDSCRNPLKHPSYVADTQDVKISPLGVAAITRKDDHQGQENLGRQQQQDKRRYKDETPQVEVTDENVAKAIADLGGELKAEHAEVQASMEGSGPGLRVVLKDGRGAVIRQMTGDEFLKLREKVEPASKGRLLDKKL